ncbi:hypothetical protein ACK3TF_003440 [Chlorella vulgaris]
MHGSPPRPSPQRPTRPGQPVPFPLLWLLVASLSAVTVLAVAHSALGTGSGANSSAQARQLLHRRQELGTTAAAAQGGAGDAGLQVQAAADEKPEKAGSVAEDTTYAAAGTEADGEEGHEGGDRPEQVTSSDEAADADAADTWSGAAAEGSGGAEEQLTDGSDLATFAAHGTHCVVTPSHGKVALLFLTHGELPHDGLWTDWIREAGGLLPRSSLAGDTAFCLKQHYLPAPVRRSGSLQPARRLGRGRSPAVLGQQHLFSLYVHARPTLKDYPEGSAFRGRLIPDRIMAKWGTHALAAAAKRLVEAAVLDQQNQWFVLVGDTTVPLYHPTLTWQQITHGTQSKVDACWHPDPHLMRRRYNPVTMRSAHFRPDDHWRKSSQWFTLNRKHADLLAADKELLAVFGTHCNAPRLHQRRALPALAAVNARTTCDFFGGTFQSWESSVDAPNKGHPRTYQPGHITPELIATIRGIPGRPISVPPSKEDEASCQGWGAATTAAQAAFIDADSVTEATCPGTLGSAAYMEADTFQDAAMSQRCVLLARKFSKPAAKWVHQLYRSCEAGLRVLPCTSSPAGDQKWWR